MARTARRRIVNSLVDAIDTNVDGTGDFVNNLKDRVEGYLRFWDEVDDFPYVCVTAGDERREYQGDNFKWGFLQIIIKAYVKNADESDPTESLEGLLADLEDVLEDSRTVSYDAGADEMVCEITIENISTDQGLCLPFGIGEIIATVRYQVL